MNTNLDDMFSQLLDIMDKRIEEYTEKGSGWVVYRVSRFDIQMLPYQPLKGGAQREPLPPKLKVKQACVNIEDNGDDGLVIAG